MGLPPGSKWLPLIVFLFRAPVTPPWLYAVRKTRLAERQCNEAAWWNNEGWRGCIEHPWKLKIKDAQMLMSPTPSLDALHRGPIHLKLNLLLFYEPSRRRRRQQWGENQNSISVTSHGSKRPLRRRQQVEKCKVTVHFTSDSVSVALAGSPVDSQPAVKVETDSACPPHTHTLPIHQYTVLCIPINWMEGEAVVSRITDTLAWCPSTLSLTAMDGASLPPSFLPFCPWLVPDKSQLFRRDNSHSSLTTASGGQRLGNEK